MVEVPDTYLFSTDRTQTTSREFPAPALAEIVDAVETVPPDVFLAAEHGHELRAFDDHIAAELPTYDYEHAPASGRNPACKLWSDSDFDHSVDLYDPNTRIAIEIEKSERKRISDDLLKFIKGAKTYRDNRSKIEFGCLIAPTNYRGTGNIYGGVQTTLDFMRTIMHVEDVAVIGYTDPRWN